MLAGWNPMTQCFIFLYILVLALCYIVPELHYCACHPNAQVVTIVNSTLNFLTCWHLNGLHYISEVVLFVSSFWYESGLHYI
jgi:hypothetical protein